MKERNTRQTRPQPGPDHPESGAEARLVQYHCAAAGDCTIPLGWEFHQPGTEPFRHGPDECQDPRIMRAIAIPRHQDRIRSTATRRAVGVLRSAMLLIAVFPFAVDIPGTTYVITAFGAAILRYPAMAAAPYAVNRWGRRTEPKPIEAA